MKDSVGVALRCSVSFNIQEDGWTTIHDGSIIRNCRIISSNASFEEGMKDEI